MTVDMPEAPELPDLPAFDKRAMRRAVRRGVIRTAFVGALWLVIASIVLGIAGQAALVGLGRRDHVQHVVAAGWQVAHPEFMLDLSSDGNGIVHTTTNYAAAPLGVQPVSASTKLSFSESLFGGVSRIDVEPKTAASQILLTFGLNGTDGASWRSAERKMLGQLPKPVRVAAIVEFAQPLSYADYTAFAARTGAGVDVQGAPLLLSAAKDLESQSDGAYAVSGVCAWAPEYAGRLLNLGFKNFDDPIGGFRAWVGSLHDSDRDALRKVGISLTTLRAAARAGLVHGVILHDTTAALLLKMLDDPAVGAVHPYDVAFAVEGSQADG